MDIRISRTGEDEYTLERKSSGETIKMTVEETRFLKNALSEMFRWSPFDN